MEPTDWYAWYNIGWAAALDGSLARSVEAFHEAARHAGEENRSSVGLGLAYAFARAGNRDSTYAYLEGSDPASYDRSVALFELGEETEAFDALELALEADASQIRRLAGDPSADGMRAHARWAEFVERYGSN
jgi:tetratricopeptide (TPR) repeat protein